MKFGIFFELSDASAVHGRQRMGRLPQRARAVPRRGRARLRSRLGGRAPLPRGVLALLGAEVFLAAVAAQTRRIRVGHGAVVCVPEMNHPIRVAERAAALDIISNGRLEFAPRARRRGPSSVASPSTPTTPRRRGTNSSACCRACGWRTSSNGAASRSPCLRATCFRSRCRSRIRRCG